MRIPVTGLWTNPNDFDSPPGSQEVLDNMTFDRPGTAEPRRGFGVLEASPTITGPIDAITSFRGSIIVHHNTTQISRWTGSAWSTYSGSYSAPSSAAAGKVHFVTANESLFVTTSAGVYELDDPSSPTGGTWRLTGAPKGLDGTATLRRTVNETGFATANGQWAYREEWGIKNTNGRLQLGAPSGRTLVQNPANVTATAGNIAKANGSTTVTVTGTTHGFATGEYVDVTLGGVETYFAAGTFQVTVVSSTSFTYSDAVNNGSGVSQNPAMPITYGFGNGRGVTRTIPIPSGITTDYFVQVYRSAKSASATTEPSDQLAQVYERSPTNLEITAGSMTITDIVLDDNRGALMDVSAETVLAAKERPPVCADLALFHNSTFCAATTTVHALEMQITAVGGTYGIQSTDLVYFSDSPENLAAQTWGWAIQGASSEAFTSGNFKVYTSGSTAQNIANTARSIVGAINGFTSNTKVYAEYISGDQEAPGKIRVYARSPSVAQFTAFAVPNTSTLFGPTWISALPDAISITDIARSGSTVTVNTAVNHGLSSGQQVELVFSTSTSHFPNGVKTVTVVDPNTFTYTEAGSAVIAEANAGWFLNAPALDNASVNIARTDRLAFSLPDQPWAVPLPNELFIDGTPTTSNYSSPTIFRLIPTRDRLYVQTDAGLFYVSGFYPDFVLTTLQTPGKSLAPECAVSTGTPGAVYDLSNTGAIEVKTVASVISTPIQDKFQALQRDLPAALKNYGFAVAYPSDYKVLFFLPEASTDTKATNAYVYHTRTGDWSRWDVDATSGMVDPVTDKLYLGLSTGAVWVERKTGYAAADYWDPGTTNQATQYTITNVSGNDLQMTGSLDFAPGDVVFDVDTSTTGIVTAVSATAITLRSAANFHPSNTLTRKATAYTTTNRWTRWVGKEGPNQDKEIDSGLVLVQPPSGSAEFTTLGLSFRNDYDPTLSSAETLTLDSTVTSQLPFKVPTNMQRSGWIQAQLTHSTGGERFRLYGISYNYRAAGVKDGY